MRYLLLSTILYAGCANPLAPSAEFTYPRELQPVMALLDADPWIHPLIGEPTGRWVRRHVRAIEMSDRVAPHGALAHFESGRVLWNPAVTPNTQIVETMVSMLIHEARHLQGFRHTCANNNDRTIEEAGAYAVQILWLEHYGWLGQANDLRYYKIGC